MLTKFVNGIIGSTSAALNYSGYHPSDRRLGGLGVFGGGGATSSGVRVDQETILGLPALMRGLNIISSTVASVPFYVFKNDNEGNRDWDKTHPAWSAVTYNANKEVPQDVFFQTMTAWAMTWGNAVAYIDRKNWPRGPVELIPLLPDRTYPVRITEKMVRKYDIDESHLGTLYYTTTIDDIERSFIAADCIHIRGLGGSPYWGYDIVDILKEAIGGAAAAQRFGGAYYGQGANPSGFIEMPSGMTPQAEARFAESMQKATGSISNAHKIIALEEGSKYHPWTVDPSKAQFIEGKEFDVRTLAQVIGIKPHKLIDGANNSYNSLSESNREHMSDDIMPWIRRWVCEFNDKLRTQPQKERDSHVIGIDDEFLEWVPFGERASGCVELYNNGVIDKEEARRRCNFGASGSPDGKRYRKPLNIGFEDESDLLLEAALAPPPAPPAPEPDDDNDAEPDDPADNGEQKLYAAIDEQHDWQEVKDKLAKMQQAWVSREARRLGKIAISQAKKGGATFDNWTVTIDSLVAPIPGVDSSIMYEMTEAFASKMNHVASSATEDELLATVTHAVAEFENFYSKESSHATVV